MSWLLPVQLHPFAGTLALVRRANPAPFSPSRGVIEQENRR